MAFTTKLILLFHFIGPWVFAQEVLVNLGNQQVSVSEFRIKQLQALAPGSKLSKEFTQANVLFESKESHLAIDYYLQIVSKAYLFEWTEVYRQVIAFSFLRLAEHDFEKRSFYIREAQKFSDPQHLKESQFPSAIFLEFKKEPRDRVEIPVFQIFNEPSFVIINSRVYQGSDLKNVSLPQGFNRITVLSDQFQDYQFTGLRKEFLTDKKTSEPWDWGYCPKPKLAATYLQKENLKVQFPDQCSVDYSQEVFIRNILTKEELGSLKSQNLAIEDLPKPITGSSFSKRESPSNIKKYLYWGLGLLAGKYLYDQYSNRKVKKIYR